MTKKTTCDFGTHQVIVSQNQLNITAEVYVLDVSTGQYVLRKTEQLWNWETEAGLSMGDTSCDWPEVIDPDEPIPFWPVDDQ